MGSSFSSTNSSKRIFGTVCQKWIQRVFYRWYGCVSSMMCIKCSYTKNRAMRLLRSSKHSVDNSKTPFNTAFSLSEWQLFLPFTLVTGEMKRSGWCKEYYFYKTRYHLLYFKGTVTSIRTPHPVRRVAHASQFPLTSLAQFILTSWENVSHVSGGFIRSWCCYESKSGIKKLRLDIGCNRWCLNKNRQHKSNHIYFIVDLGQGGFYQKCHDVECSNFLSPLFPLPPSAVEEAIKVFDSCSCLLMIQWGTEYIAERVHYINKQCTVT